MFRIKIKMIKKLKEYIQKRHFDKTTEPKPKKATQPEKQIFVIQKHDASHLHYDFRLEINGVLKSWAIPKGPTNDPDQKRLAIPTEDHPIEYATFQGNIPEGQYGAGTVEIWDKGSYQNIKTEKTMQQCLDAGQIEVKLNGKKLKGNFVLIHTNLGGKNNWLFKKMKTHE